MSNDPIELVCGIVVSAAPNDGFERFVDEFSTWWPTQYTWSQSGLDWIGLDPTNGGRCTERGVGGFEVDFGRVLAVQRPSLATKPSWFCLTRNLTNMALTLRLIET